MAMLKYAKKNEKFSKYFDIEKVSRDKLKISYVICNYD